MEALYIKSTDSTPTIKFTLDTFNFTIEGISKPEDVRKFYYPVIEWLDNFHEEYVEAGNKALKYAGLTLNIKLTYFNSSSAKFLFDILDKFSEYQDKGISIKVHWYFEDGDDDHLEAGEELSDMCGIQFNYIAWRDEDEEEKDPEDDD